MCKVVCNIPHSSTIIPKWAMADIIINQTELSALVDFMTDKNVEKIWNFVPSENKEVAAISRIMLDTERFKNDADEPMSAKGMGLYYTHTPNGKQFRLKNPKTYNKCLSIYDAYHKSLEEKVTKCLNEHGKSIVLDCHSFHDNMDYTGYSPASFPDVCIGVNGEIFSEARFIISAFEAKEYSVNVNHPFAGSLVPLKYLNDSRVVSVMIELNRRIYDNSSFQKVQNICKEIFNELNG